MPDQDRLFPIITHYVHGWETKALWCGDHHFFFICRNSLKTGRQFDFDLLAFFRLLYWVDKTKYDFPVLTWDTIVRVSFDHSPFFSLVRGVPVKNMTAVRKFSAQHLMSCFPDCNLVSHTSVAGERLIQAFPPILPGNIPASSLIPLTYDPHLTLFYAYIIRLLIRNVKHFSLLFSECL